MPRAFKGIAFPNDLQLQWVVVGYSVADGFSGIYGRPKLRGRAASRNIWQQRIRRRWFLVNTTHILVTRSRWESDLDLGLWSEVVLVLLHIPDYYYERLEAIYVDMEIYTTKIVFGRKVVRDFVDNEGPRKSPAEICVVTRHSPTLFLWMIEPITCLNARACFRLSTHPMHTSSSLNISILNTFFARFLCSNLVHVLFQKSW